MVDAASERVSQLWRELQEANTAVLHAIGRWRKGALGGVLPYEQTGPAGPPGLRQWVAGGQGVAESD